MYKKETLKKMSIEDLKEEKRKVWDYFCLLRIILKAKEMKVI